MAAGPRDRAVRLALLTAILALAAPAYAQQESTSGAADYVGDAACLACHSDVSDTYVTTLHARALRPGASYAPTAARGCEACHGPGSAHASSGGRPEAHDLVRFDTANAEAAARESAACLSCHAGARQTFWATSRHAADDLSCTSCHTTKRDVSPRSQLTRATETETCGLCHVIERAQTFRNAHKPTREGRLECSACHEAHGGPGEGMLRAASVNDTCYACHADLRGPFLWEHAPVTEDCLSCHEAHGSVRSGLLKLSQPRLCQQCHAETLHPTDARLPENRFVVGGACLQCHQSIHGSNHPSGFALIR